MSGPEAAESLSVLISEISIIPTFLNFVYTQWTNICFTIMTMIGDRRFDCLMGVNGSRQSSKAKVRFAEVSVYD